MRENWQEPAKPPYTSDFRPDLEGEYLKEADFEANRVETNGGKANRGASRGVDRGAEVSSGTAFAPGRMHRPETAGVRDLTSLPAAGVRQRNRLLNRIEQAFGDGNAAQSLGGLIHDARNMVLAMDLYCGLLEEPGVLSAPFQHYADDLRLVGGAGRRLLEKLAVVESTAEFQFASLPQPSLPQTSPSQESPSLIPPSGSLLESSFRPKNELISNAVRASVPPSIARQGAISTPISIPDSDNLKRSGRRQVFQENQMVESLAEELQANQNLLSALVGPGITVGLSLSGGRQPIAMTRDDLTRTLVNLARNAADAMPCGGHIQIALEEGAEYLSLSFTDNGPGIPTATLETIFSPGYSTHVRLDPGLDAGFESGLDSGHDSSPVGSPEQGVDSAAEPDSCAWPVQHRGLGLAIVRSIVSAAGGSVWAANRMRDPVSAATNPVAFERDKTVRPASVHDPDDGPPQRGAVLLIEFPLHASPMVS